MVQFIMNLKYTHPYPYFQVNNNIYNNYYIYYY